MITNDARQFEIFKLDDLLNKIINHMARNDFISEIVPTQEIDLAVTGGVGKEGIIIKLNNLHPQMTLSIRSGQPELFLDKETRNMVNPICR